MDRLRRRRPDGAQQQLHAYIIATDSQGNAVKANDQTTTQRVDGYKEGRDGKGYFTVGGNTLALSDVVAVKETYTSSSALACLKNLLGLSDSSSSSGS